jgi:deoxyribose-phosphate aldolase
MNTPTLSIAEPAPFDAAAFAAHALASPAALAAVLDHTLLKPEATRAQVIRLCHEAAEHRFACAMVNPTWVACAAETLAGTGVPVGVVIGFPLGATLAASKRDETARVLKLGAHDLDMVLNIGLLKSGGKEDYEAVRQDIRGWLSSRTARAPSSRSCWRHVCSRLRRSTAPRSLR